MNNLQVERLRSRSRLKKKQLSLVSFPQMIRKFFNSSNPQMGRFGQARAAYIGFALGILFTIGIATFAFSSTYQTKPFGLFMAFW